MTEHEASQDLDIRHYGKCWAKAKEVVGYRVEVDSPDYWPNVRKHFIEIGGQYKTPRNPIGAGTKMIMPDPTYVYELTRRLMEIPNAFDTVTGKLNRENDKAVILYEMWQTSKSYLEFPIYWKYDERTPNAQRSDQPNQE